MRQITKVCSINSILRKVVFIMALGLWGCNSTSPLDKLDEKIIFSNESNFYVNLDSLETMDNYIMYHRAARKNGLSKIKPYIKTVEGKRISLSEIRPRTGRGYSFDGRSKLMISIDGESDYFCTWSTGKSRYTNDCINYEKSFTSKVDLMNEILTFYTENSEITFENEPDKSELEIVITPIDDKLSKCKEVIELSALAYQRFLRNTEKNGIPFLIFISAKIDNNRMKRIIEKENQKLNFK